MFAIILCTLVFTAIGLLFLFLSLPSNNRRFIAFTLILFFILAFVVSYFFHPSLSLSEIHIYAWGLAFAGLGLFSGLIINDALDGKKIESKAKKVASVKGTVYFASLGIILLLAYAITSSAMFNANKFRDRLALTETEVFDPKTTLIDAENGRYVDQYLAFKTAQTMLSERLGLGSRYEFDDLRIQSINGQLYWVAPLVNKSLIKWFNNSQSPGFVMVSATDINDASLMLDKFPITFGDHGFYGFDNIQRHLYANGFMLRRFGTPSLELRDSDLKPFWIIPIIHSEIGVSGLNVQSLVMLDATTGDFEEFSIADTPQWIDRVYPENIFSEQVDDWGSYIDGWFNAVFIGDDVIRATEGTLFTYTSSGQGVWYTGVQSDGSTQEGTMGFVMGNSRTGEATFYRRQGLTEQVAQSVMEGAVQEAGYTASSPQPYNVNGITTYVSILKDSNGNRQGYGMVAYNNRDIFATGTTPQAARREFLNKLLSNLKGDDLAQAAGEQLTLTAVVERVAVMSDNILLLVQGESKHIIFSIPKETNFEAPLSAPGDTVILKYSKVDASPQPVTCFDNINIGEALCD